MKSRRAKGNGEYTVEAIKHRLAEEAEAEREASEDTGPIDVVEN